MRLEISRWMKYMTSLNEVYALWGCIRTSFCRYGQLAIHVARLRGGSFGKVALVKAICGIPCRNVPCCDAVGCYQLCLLIMRGPTFQLLVMQPRFVLAVVVYILAFLDQFSGFAMIVPLLFLYL